MLQYHLGPSTKHTIYEPELIGFLLAFHLLNMPMCHSTSTVIIGLDNQMVIWSLNNQRAKPAHYLLDLIHDVSEHLQSQQDHTICREVFQQAKLSNHNVRVKTRNVCDVHIHWVPGHSNFEPNEKVDDLAKKPAVGESSPLKNLLASPHPKA